MPPYSECEIVVVGAGIVGLAVARAAIERGVRAPLVLEAEPGVATHQTGHNSGVIHSGLYYRPGSLKARLCTAGRVAMERFCDEHGVPRKRCGKIVAATEADELPRLEELERRGRANGLAGVRRLDRDEIRRHEPHLAAEAGLLVPETGVTDFGAVARALVRVIEDAGGTVRTGTRVRGGRPEGDRVIVETDAGRIVARRLVNCAGLQSDRLARAMGAAPGVRIVPFRGEYGLLTEEAAELVRGLIYPVPDPRFPFLGVHLTRTIDGRVKTGPNAVLSLARHGYRRTAFSLRDVMGIVGYAGTWRLFRRYWRTGGVEFWRSLSRSAQLRLLQRLLPELRREDLRPGPTGVRAQAVGPDGALIDDFRIVHDGPAVHVLNAPSPAATASLAIGASIVERCGIGDAAVAPPA